MHKLLSKSLSFKKLYVSAIIIAGCWLLSSGIYIHAKAQLAQLLLNNAWSKTLQGDSKVKPWNWADTYPIAKITFTNQQKHYIVLEGGSGHTMAFGPGHVSTSPLPGQGGNSVIVGHRDTHFTALKDLTLGDGIQLQLPNKDLNYKVVNTFIVDQNQSEILLDDGSELLTLITCYPFEAIQPGGPLRYVVQATLI